jgi:glycosyltransferase involved in cell wall biosynthesis
LGITDKYILYPTNECSHKNVGAAVAATAILREKGYSVNLVLTGPGMDDRVTGTATRTGVRRDHRAPTVFGLGYVSNLEIDVLIQRAEVVISTSLYEAGCGPGLDAWARAVPVAMSNIPAFTEHIAAQGVNAKLFDPRSPEDIAKNIAEIFDFPEIAKASAASSRNALSKLSWKECSGRYLKVFGEVIEGASR